MPRWAKNGLLASVALFFSGSAAEGRNTGFRPGQPWPDTDGAHINAHGYCILKHDGKYHWYGSHKIAGKTESEKNEAGVRCYVSSDLLNWKNSGLVLSVTSEGQHPEVAKAGVLDRPKVIFNPATRKFVMYFKLYPPKAAGGTVGTEVAYVGVATADEPLGPFEYQGNFRGADSTSGSGDFAMFQDDDGAIHEIALRKPDKALVLGRMSEEGLRPEGKYTVMQGVTHVTEAPALFRRKGRIFLLGSGSTGWNPNPARMFVADQLAGPYLPLGNPCGGVNPHDKPGPEKTFGGQSTFVMPSPWNPDEWIVQNLDWSDPRTTEGHRMRGHRTIPSLVWLLQNYPDHAPAGLKEKITAWSEVAAKRSANLCDIRRFDDGDNWTIPKLNVVGNWLATPGIALAASWVIDDPKLKSRMREIAVSHADAVFGRNPRLAAAPNKPELGFTGIERGWPISHKPKVCARLELCRGSISATPKAG
jgi:hypothetical protein